MELRDNPSSGSRVVLCGQTDRQTDMTKLIVAFRDFMNAPEKPLPGALKTPKHSHRVHLITASHCDLGLGFIFL
jgi:hypothetical protein